MKIGRRLWMFLQPEGGLETGCAGFAGGIKAVVWAGVAVLAGVGLGQL